MKLFQKLKGVWKTTISQPKGERFSYFWEYYKWPTTVSILLVAALICTLVGVANRKDTIFDGYVLNSNAIEKDKEFLQGFYDYAGIDSEKYEAAVYTDMYLRPGNSQKNAEVFQRILGGIYTQAADFIAGPPEAFRMCAYQSSELFVDLREFLDEETLNKLSDRLYYIDYTVLEQLRAPVGEATNANITYPDPHKPELMEQPIPVGISVGDRESFRASYYYYPDTELYIGIVKSTARPELSRQFIHYLFP